MVIRVETQKLEKYLKEIALIMIWLVISLPFYTSSVYAENLPQSSQSPNVKITNLKVYGNEDPERFIEAVRSFLNPNVVVARKDP